MEPTPLEFSRYRHVACCVDESEASAVALEAAGEVCRLGKGRLRVVHVVSMGGSPTPLTSPDPRDTPAAGGRHGPGWDLLGRAMRCVRGEPVLLEGSHPAAAVCRWAEQQRVDLLVVAAYRGRMARAALGSFAGHLAHHAHCSVLIVRPAEGRQAEDDEHIEHIACFVDGSAASPAAVEEAHSLASAIAAHLSVVHVSTVPFALPLSWQVVPRAEYSSAMQQWLVGLTAGRAGAEPVVLVGFGQSSALACDWAQSADVDLMVVASHSGPAARIALGSFTNYLACHASSSVLVVRHGTVPPGREATSLKGGR